MLLLTREPTHQKIPFKHSSIEPLGNGKGAAVSRWFGFCCLRWAATVHMKLSHGSCQQSSRSLFPMAFSCWCFGRMKKFHLKGGQSPFDDPTDNSQHYYVPRSFLSEGRGSVAASWRLSCGHGRRADRGSVVPGLSPDIDRHLRASTVGIRGRDGDNPSPGSPSGAGTRCHSAQC
jgi:hypothetical protein